LPPLNYCVYYPWRRVMCYHPWGMVGWVYHSTPRRFVIFLPELTYSYLRHWEYLFFFPVLLVTYSFGNLARCLVVWSFSHFLRLEQCRQARITYHGEFKLDVCLQCNENGAQVRHTLNFGHLPIMLMVVTLSFLLVKWHFPWNNFVMDKVSMLLDFGVYRSNRG